MVLVCFVMLTVLIPEDRVSGVVAPQFSSCLSLLGSFLPLGRDMRASQGSVSAQLGNLRLNGDDSADHKGTCSEILGHACL